MARIPTDELERLKRETDLAALVRSRGVELRKHGGSDLIGRCVFHDDTEPSLVVTPGKNLFHCLGCGAAGSVVDWVMKTEGVSFRHAVELLREGSPSLAASDRPLKRTTVRRLPCPLELDAEDAELLGQVVGYYHETLQATPRGSPTSSAGGWPTPTWSTTFPSASQTALSACGCRRRAARRAPS